MRLIDVDRLPLFVATSEAAEKMMDTILEAIENAPTVNPVKHGRWKLLSEGRCKCSVCEWVSGHYDDDSVDRYCSHCGAKNWW